MRTSFVTCLGTLTFLVAAGAVAAPLPPAYFTFLEPRPVPGATDVARDTAIVLTVKAWSDYGSINGLEVGSISVTDSTGADVAMASLPTGAVVVSYYPIEPFEANEEITVAAALVEHAERPADATGETLLEFSFTTGDDLLPPLTLEGVLQARIEAGEVPVTECTGSGSRPSCVQVGTRAAYIARVALPKARGGFDALPYSGYLLVTDDVPASFDGPGGDVSKVEHRVNVLRSVQPRSDESVVLEVVMADNPTPYEPCFALNVWDNAGHWAAAAPVCLESIDTTDIALPPNGDGGADAADIPSDAGVDAADGSRDAASEAGDRDADSSLDDASSDTGAAGSSNSDEPDDDSTLNGGSTGAHQEEPEAGRAAEAVGSDMSFDQDSGCGCTQAGSSRGANWMTACLLMLGAVCRRRR